MSDVDLHGAETPPAPGATPSGASAEPPASADPVLAQFEGKLAAAQAEAARIGYPVMLKSTAGGGGIGMRLIWSADELVEAFQSVERLARANFKEAGIFLEKYVEHAPSISRWRAWAATEAGV